MSTYAIGDVQGCFDELQDLLDAVGFTAGTDQLWFVGDMINRGPNNLETLRFIRGLGASAVSVLGNHDLHFLAIATGGHRPVRRDTVGDLLRAEDLDDIIEWLRHLPLVHHDAALDYTMVHAGLPPQWSLDESLARADEVHAVLRGEAYRDFFPQMYGNEPAVWDKGLQGYERLRLITNYFTRMRFCTPAGRLELTAKANDAPMGYSEWFRQPRPLQRGVRIVFGHWAALEGVRHGSVAGIDTGCVWGRHLTAMRLEDGRWFQVPARKS